MPHIKTIKTSSIMEFGRYTVSDHGDKFIVSTSNFALCIYKGMLNSRAREIIDYATSGNEEAIKRFLREYIKGLGEVCQSVEILINTK